MASSDQLRESSLHNSGYYTVFNALPFPGSFKEQNTACKQGNKVKMVKISPYIHITMALERGR